MLGSKRNCAQMHMSHELALGYTKSMNDEKKSYNDLKQELNEAAKKIEVGGLYAHYKQPELPYKIRGFAVWEETDEVAVLYQPVHEPEVIFVRPLKIWLETVEWQGQTVSRFSKV